VFAVDFQFDVTTDGRPIKIVSIVDEHTANVESFASRIRDKCLNVNSFWSLAAPGCPGRVVISDWKHDYNHHRRHSALGYQAPARYAAACTHQ
jgi:hypothetical protein